MAALTGHHTSHNFLAGTTLLTTTSQFRCVALTATSGSPGTVGLANTTTGVVIGINQTYLTAGASAVCQVATHGFSKAICAASVTAGDVIVAGVGGGVETFAAAAAVTTTAFVFILGRALETGSTNTNIGVFIQPQFIER